MSALAVTAEAFVEMAHRIVWATVATVDDRDRPRSRILHPVWQWDGSSLVGWIATSPTPIKRAHLSCSPYALVTYWTESHDTCTADCRVEWVLDDEHRQWVWDLFSRRRHRSATTRQPCHRGRVVPPVTPSPGYGWNRGDCECSPEQRCAEESTSPFVGHRQTAAETDMPD